MTNQSDYFFKRNSSFVSNEISLDYLDLQILTLVEQNKSAREIARELDISPALLKLKITALHRNRVITIIENYNSMDMSFSEQIRKALLDMMGPMGVILLDEVLDCMQLRIDNIPRVVAKDIIAMIAKKIPDQEYSQAFLSRMQAALPST